MIEKGLFQLVTSNAGVQTAVGVDANGIARAYWVLAPQGAQIPFLVFSRIGTVDTYAMAGTTGLREGMFQIACYASAYYTSRQISGTVRRLLENFKGALPDVDATVVQAVFIDKDFDLRYEEGGKGFIYGAILQFRIWFNS
jgi:hypothetical protein